MFQISLDTKSVTRKLNLLVDGITNPKAVLSDMGKQLEVEKELQFQAEGAHLTGKWKALAPATIRQRVAQGYGAGPILQRTGKLKKSFKVKKLTKEELHYGSSGVIYFPIHQKGGVTFEGWKIPKRPMLAVNSKLVKPLMEIYQKYIHNLLKK